MERCEVIDLLSMMVVYWESRANDNYHDFKSRDLFLRYVNAAAEAVVLLEEDEKLEDDFK